MAYLDATGESLAGLLRPGNAGSGTAADHVKVLDQALFQLPKDPKTTEVICRTDTAGCSHEFLDAARIRGALFDGGTRGTSRRPFAESLPGRRRLVAGSGDRWQRPNPVDERGSHELWLLQGREVPSARDHDEA